MRSAIVLLFLTALLFSLVFSISKVYAPNGEVKFRGMVLCNEGWGDTACYGNYYCTVMVQWILIDPEGLLTNGSYVPICYNTQLNLTVDELVECYGFYFLGAGPMQCVGWCVCSSASIDYYVIRASILGDVDHDWDVDIFDVVRCVGAYGSTPIDPNWDIFCDIADPYELIDIFDIMTIVSSYGEEYTP